ncbi:hypothetical protein LZ554_008461 [Drepanopeziza brunnea f. sp. 'monogermtubi']|nr:hypothetical protein LZ554_008461 [Drepanopeziza brunnea f. sp. 'monogermtubi']
MATSAFAQSSTPNISKSIVLSARGLTHDVILRVFDTELHVHSIILKQQSAFFFKFLDSPDKASLPAPNGPYAYEWVTKIDDDGKSWSLAANDGKVRVIT